MSASMSERHFICFTSEDVKQIVNGTENAAGVPVAGTAEITIPFGLLMSSNVPSALRKKKFVLAEVEVMRATGASVTAYTPQVYDVSGALTTAWATKYLGGSTAAGTRFGVTKIEALMRTDASGNLFFKVNGDAADTFNYTLWFEVIA